MKKIVLLLLFVLPYSITKLKATHVVGAEITYKYIGNDNFELKLVVYRDCQGIQLFAAPINVKTACSNFSVSLNRVSVTDATGISSKCPLKSRCTTGPAPYGFEKHIFTGVFKMPSDTCCNYLFSWQACCRNTAITTGASDQRYYTETRYNKCLAPNNSSPAAIADPRLLVGVGEAQSLFYTAYDSIDNDSVSYEFAEPLQDSVAKTSFIGSFSSIRPLTFLGFPVNAFPFPRGFHLNTTTSEVRFTPTRKNEVGLFAIKAIEWRKINGTYTKIGEVIRDVQLWVITDTSKSPIIERDKSTIGMCNAVGTYCQLIPLSSKSGNSSDTISIEYITNTPNITIRDLRLTPSKTAIEVCIKVDSSVLKSAKKPSFVLQVNDNSCPINKSTTKTFYFDTKPPLPDSFDIDINLGKCREVTATFVNNSSILPKNKLWKIWNNKDTAYFFNDSSIINSFNDTGWVYASLSVFSEDHCGGNEYKDSIYIGTERFLEISLPQDKITCFKQVDTLELLDTLKKGVTPYTYRWSISGDSSAKPIFNVQLGSRNVWVNVTDANGCEASDTIVLSNYAPKVTITSAPQTCVGVPFGTRAVLSQALQPVYEWVGFTKNNPFLIDTPTSNTSYRFILEDKFGCKVDTTISVIVLDLGVSINGDTNYCSYDTVNLNAVTTGGTLPIQTTWQPNATNGSSLQILPSHTVGNRLIKVFVKDNSNCKDSATISLKFNPKPTINITPLPIYCEVDSNSSLVSFSNPKGGVWSGQGVINDSIFSPQQANTGTSIINYYFKDNVTNCYNSDTASITVVKQAKASFFALKTNGFPNDTFNFINTTPNNSALQNRWEMGDIGKPNNTQTTNNAFYSYTDTGIYSVTLRVKNANCPEDVLVKTNYITIASKTNLSVSTINSLPLKLYPNPAKDKLTIEADNPLAEIVLVDVLGKRYEIESFNRSTKTEVSIAHLAAGVYVIEIKDIEGSIYTSKVMVSK